MMTSIKIKYRPSQKENGEGLLYYQVIRNRVPRQVRTGFRIFSFEWDEKQETVRFGTDDQRNNYLRSVQYGLKYDQQKISSIAEQANENVSVDELIADYEHDYFQKTLLFNFMEMLIERYNHNGQIRTAETYRSALNSFRRFRGGCDIPLEELSADIIESYQSYLRHNDAGVNTISFYMRRLRAVYNRAVEQKLVSAANLFRHVHTGMEKTVKRAISTNAVSAIKMLQIQRKPSREFARDLFLFSLYTRGMSFIDMAFLLKTNLRDGILTYRRKKTGQKLTIVWKPEMQYIVDKYNLDDSPYLLPVIRPGKGDERKQYRHSNANINRNLKLIGKSIGLSTPLTMYVARHTWASIARDIHIPLSVISEGLGHDNEVTTQIYLSTVRTDAVDDANSKIIGLI